MNNQLYIPNLPIGEFACSISGIDLNVSYLMYPIAIDENSHKPLHEHIYYEVIHIFDGETALEYDDGEVSIKAGDTIIVSPTVNHRFLDLEKKIACKICITVKRKTNPDNIFRAFEREMNKQGFVIITDADPKNRLKLEHIFTDFIDCTTSIYRLNTCFANMFLALCECISKDYYVDKVNTHAKCDLTDVITNAMIYRYTTNITVKDIAEKTFFSERHINRICNKIWGRPFNTQKNYFRIQKAKNMLLNTDKTILQISIECGFSSESNFYASFEKFEGITPKKYKMTHTNENIDI